MVVYKRVRVSQALVRSGLYDLDYALNPYAGCEHGCLYCYARAYTRYRDAAESWGEIVYVKENIVEVLAREARHRKPGVVGVSTITDPYQPIEREEMLTRKCLQVLLSAGFHVSIQTKSDMVTRDLDILHEHRKRVDVGFTITTLDNGTAALIEPRAPPPSLRARALKEVASAGLETWVFLGPIIRGVNDSEGNIRRIARLAADTGSTLYYDYLRIRPGVSLSLGALVTNYPHVLSTDPMWRRAVSRLVESICGEEGVKCVPAFPPKDRKQTLDKFLTFDRS